MRYRVCIVLLASLLAAVICICPDFRGLNVPGASAAETKKEERKTETGGGLPPLVIDRSAPLLLDEPPQEDPLAISAGPVVDNLACHCCHMNYQEEPLALEHAKANVGCMKCHGKSLAHRDDEDNVTPPDVMFPHDKIDASCKKCHDDHDVSPAEVIARWQQRCPEKTDPRTIVCTDCHGHHRLQVRVVRWDKNTGALLPEKQDDPAKAAGGKPDCGKPACDEPECDKDEG